MMGFEINPYHKALAFLIIFTLIVGILFLLISPIPQDLHYHNFADKRTLFSIKYFFNVFSNIAFIIAGILGLVKIFSCKQTDVFKKSTEQWPYIVLFIGSILTGIGSGYYHLNPNNATLFWDRAPMCIISMSYFSAILMERVNRKLGLYLLVPLIIIGILGVIHWELSELNGQGDLRLYGLMQFYPIAMILLMLILFPSPYTGTYYIVESFGWYTIAKLGEFFDKGVYILTLHAISGHTIKHLAAALGIYSIVRYLKHRKIK